MAAKRVIGFYGHRAGAPFREFSNFYVSSAPFRFTLPGFARRDGFPESVLCEFSEKAIMIVKAALMMDKQSFDEICRARDPGVCKRLGRKVKGFDPKLWDAHLPDTAFEVVRQKFAADAGLRLVLLGTGDAILAEATQNDRIWGIGLKVGDPRVQDRKQWQGRNILGDALMRARDALRAESDLSVPPAEPAAPHGASPQKRRRTESSVCAAAMCEITATSSSGGMTNKGLSAGDANSSSLSQLLEMGFPEAAAKEALAAVSGDVRAAVEHLTAESG